MQKRSHEVYQRIYALILNGVLKPGQKLSLRKLAAEVQSSVTPVIEALNLLMADGMVESRPHWGYFVALPTRRQIAGYLVMREAIECQVAWMLNEKSGVRKRQRLRTSATKLDAMVAGFGQGRHTEAGIERAHCEFHMEMAEMTDCAPLVEALHRINLQFLLIKADSAGLHHEVPANWHSWLVEGILEGTPEHAAAAMRQHVRHSESMIFDRMPPEAPAPLSSGLYFPSPLK